jgi:arylsulfatase A-like enzyme
MHKILAGLLTALLVPAAPALAAPKPHNIIVYVADGLRSRIVTPQTAPAMAALRAEGVDFRESHSLFPTVTTPNASAIATGHGLGDSGDFGNSVFAGLPALPLTPSRLLAGLENDPTLGAMNDRFDGDFLGRSSLLSTARAAGYSTAAVGKLGPTAIQDVTARDGKTTIVIDDSTGGPEGLPLTPEFAKAVADAGFAPKPPSRTGNNAFAGNATTPGTLSDNALQQDWLIGVTAKVVLPRFKAANKPFAMVFWSRDPDGSQHDQGDSLNAAEPGINGPTSMAGIRNADNGLAKLRATLKELGLDKTTDIVVTADHAFSTIWKQSETSPSTKFRYADVPAGFLPPGFLSIDLAQGLGLPLYDPTGETVSPGEGVHPRKNSAVLGADAKNPQIVVAANGGADLIWLPTGRAKEWASKIAAVLAAQDYTAALFVDDALGPVPGALPLSAIGLTGGARTPRPSMVVSFRSLPGKCADVEICSLDIADTELQQGQGSHGSFSRTDTHNFMAAAGPSFKKGFVDPTPVSNADWTQTLAKAHGLTLPKGGAIPGRVMSEALAGGKAAASEVHVTRSEPAANGFTTVLNWRSVADARYYDAAGMPGRVVGLKP